MPVVLAVFLTLSALPASEFNVLQKRVNSASFTKEKMSIIKRLPKTATLSCAQTAALVKTFSFAKDQLALIELLTPKIDNLSNRQLIIEQLTFSGDKARAGEILDQAHAEREDARQAKAEEAKATQKAQAAKRARELKALRAMSHKKQITALKKWSERLNEREEQLAKREQALAKREQALAKREARLRAGKSKVSITPAPRPTPKTKGQALSWIGYCPRGLTPKGITKGACQPFDAARFNPTSQHGQRLMLQVAKPGPVTITIASGPKMKGCTVVGKRETSAKETIKVARPNQVIDLTRMVDNWKVDYIHVTAQSKGKKTTMRIDDWQGCER